jgi:GT2 family glycosyltransferase
VVVVNWNVRDLLLECLASLFHALDVASLFGQVWVVDNASGDGSVQAVQEEFAHDDRTGLSLQVVASPRNLWFGGGQNLAMRAMGFDEVAVPDGALKIIQESIKGWSASKGSPERTLPRYVLVLNPDTLLRAGALGEMVRFMDRTPGAGVCGPRLVYGNGRFQHSAYRFPTLAQTFFDFWPLYWRLTESRLNGRYARRQYQAGKPFPIDHPLGAAMLVRSEVVGQTGGFDLSYRMYVEEIDWCMRVKRAGWDIYCVPAAELVHYEGQSTQQVRPDMVVALWRSRYRLFAKYYSPLYRRVARRLIRAGMRAKIRQTQNELGQGQVDEGSARSLIDAYQQVIALS